MTDELNAAHEVNVRPPHFYCVTDHGLCARADPMARTVKWGLARKIIFTEDPYRRRRGTNRPQGRLYRSQGRAPLKEGAEDNADAT